MRYHDSYLEPGSLYDTSFIDEGLSAIEDIENDDIYDVDFDPNEGWEDDDFSEDYDW